MDPIQTVSVVLPTYNERENIVPLVGQLLEMLPYKGLEVLVVDDSSPDGTANVVNEKFAEDDRVRVIVRSENPGLAFSIREGVTQADGDIVLVMDTDFNHKPEDALILCRIAESVDLVVGSRFIVGGGMNNRLRYSLSYLYNIFLRCVLGTRLDDNLSGFFAIRRDVLNRLDFDKIFWGYGDYFIRLLLMTQRLNVKTVQVPVRYGDRLAGETKTRFLKVFRQYTTEVFKLCVWRMCYKW